MESLNAFATRSSSGLMDEPEQLKAHVAQLERELSRLRETIAPIGLVQFDAETGRLISASEVFCAFVGHREAELRHRSTADLVHPEDDLPRDQAGSAPAFQDRRFVTKDGRIVWASVAVTFLRTPAGRLIGTAVVHDITRQKEALARADDANRFLSAVLESSTQGVISVDGTGRITLVNLGAEEIFGYRREELIGQPIDLLVPERFHHVHAGHRQNYFRDPRNRPMGQGSELIGRRKDESEFPAEITLSYVAGAHGPTATVFVNDITERKKAQMEANQARDRFASLLASSSRVSIIATEINGTIRVFNAGAEAMLGYRPDDLLGKKSPEAFHLASEVEARSQQIFAESGRSVTGFAALVEAARSGGFDEREWTYVRADGTHLTVNLAVTAVRDSQGVLSGFLGIATDVTDRVLLRQKLEEALRHSQEDLRTIVQAAPLAIVTVDSEAKVTSWNRAAETIFGYSTGEVLGRFDPSIPQGRAQDFQDLLNTAASGRRMQARGRRITKSGEPVEVSCSVASLSDVNQGVHRAVIVIEDITERFKAETELARVRTALATAREDEARRIARDLHDDITQRLSMLSVDLGRTASEVRSLDDVTTKCRSYQERIIEVSKGIRDISHRMHPSILDDLGLEDALGYLCTDFSEREGIPVWFRADGLPPEIPRGLSSCFYRVTQEALSNISKYARASEVNVQIGTTEAAIELRIIDNGIGFDAASSASGLGLHSMRERAELVGGTFTTVSEPGAGTRLVISVPQAGTPDGLARNTRA